MRIATIVWNDRETSSLYFQNGLVPIPLLNQHLQTDWSSDLFEILSTGQFQEMIDWYREEDIPARVSREMESCLIPETAIEFAPLYRNPGKIWGIGLNYSEHARDLAAAQPEEFPASFMKPATTLIGQGDYIKIPALSKRTTAEAELGIIIGKKARNLKPEQAMEVVAGYAPVIDITAEDILQMNPRYLTLSKSFDSFFSMGPCFISRDEVPDLHSLQVATWINGKQHAANTVAHMRFVPEELIAFHSRVMTLLPGDIISTGTPGATPVAEGDEVECHIEGFPVLSNRVFDLKKGK